MPSKLLLMASKMREAKFSSPVLIIVLEALILIKALFGSIICKIYSVSAPFLSSSTGALIPIFCNDVTRLCKLTEPQCINSPLCEETTCSFPGSNRCFPCSTESSPFSLAIVMLSSVSFVHLSWEAKSVAMSSSGPRFNFGIRSVTFSVYWMNEIELELEPPKCCLKFSGNWIKKKTRIRVT